MTKCERRFILQILPLSEFLVIQRPSAFVILQILPLLEFLVIRRPSAFRLADGIQQDAPESPNILRLPRISRVSQATLFGTGSLQTTRQSVHVESSSGSPVAEMFFYFPSPVRGPLRNKVHEVDFYSICCRLLSSFYCCCIIFGGL